MSPSNITTEYFGRRSRILFVDDEPSVLQGVARALSTHSDDEWDILFAGNGLEALAKMEQNQVDVLVTDIAMPLMDGKELLEKTRDRFPGTVMVVLSGHWNQASALAYLGSDVRFLAKPVSNELLAWTLRQAIDQADATRRLRLRGERAADFSEAITPEGFDLRNLIGEEFSLLDPTAKGKRVGLYSEISPDVPALLSGQPSLIRKCLKKTLSNAISSTNHGSVTLRVTQVWPSNSDIPLHFEIEDTGTGLAFDARARLMDAFKQASQPGGELGLAETRRLALMMGGEAGFDSRQGEGSIFWFVAMAHKR